MYPDCRVNPMRPGRNELIMGSVPCTPHPSSQLLQFSIHWQDRPHLATREHYERRLFDALPPEAKVCTNPLSHIDRDERALGACMGGWGHVHVAHAWMSRRVARR